MPGANVMPAMPHISCDFLVEEKKHFFFEKKKQKTLFLWLRILRMGTAKSQKFFGSFFQKRTSLLS
jgi:hypothetical protein